MLNADTAPDCRMLHQQMLADGGWHTVASLQAHWDPTYTATELRAMLRLLVALGHVQRISGATLAAGLLWSADLSLACPVRSAAITKAAPAAIPALHPLQQCWASVGAAQ